MSRPVDTVEDALAELIREGRVEARQRPDGVWEYRTIRPWRAPVLCEEVDTVHSKEVLEPPR